MCVSLGVGLFFQFHIDEPKPASNLEQEDGKLIDMF